MSLAYFPLFPADFDADTGHLSFAEDGAYNRLLRLCWRCPGCKMPGDTTWIYRKIRAVSDADKAVVDAVMAEFFTTKGGKIFNKRLLIEWVKASEAHAKRISAGSAGGKAKAKKIKEKEPSNAVAIPKQPEPEPEPYKDTEANASAASGADGAEDDFAKQLFDRSVSFLGRHGTPDRQARSFVGKLRKDHPDPAIFAAFAACGKAGAVDPIPWITAHLGHVNGHDKNADAIRKAFAAIGGNDEPKN